MVTKFPKTPCLTVHLGEGSYIRRSDRKTSMSVEIVSIKDMPLEARAELVRQLGYTVDGQRVLRDGEPVMDPYLDLEVTLANMAVLPGSSILLVDNAVSFAGYFEEHEDWG